jgi:nicotinate-nucleotide adenylyltransferase
MLIGIFGGAFDPIHKGHLNLANNILNKKSLDKILFVPTARPPHKPNNPVTSFTHRFEMTKLAILDNVAFKISDIENENADQYSYSLLTVQKLKEIYKDAKFSLIIGGDSLKMLHTWYSAAELVNECNIISYPRPGHCVELDYLLKKWPKNIAEKLFASILDLPLTDISSTRIRNDFYASPKIRNYLPEKVEEYMLKNDLYKK